MYAEIAIELLDPLNDRLLYSVSAKLCVSECRPTSAQALTLLRT